MRRILGAILILFVTSAVSLRAETFCQSSITDKTVVVFGNGIMNTKDDATRSRNRIKELFGATLSPEEFSKLEFGLAYNQSYGFFNDLYESAKQKLGAENVIISFWRWLGGQEAMPDELQKEVKTMAAQFDFATRVAPEDLNNHVLLYRTGMLEGKRVLVFAHSQGNFFVNAAYEKLFTGDQALATSQSFGIIAIATPASYTVGDGPYTTLVEDLVIQAISLVTPPGVLPPRSPNITNIGSGAVSSDWKGHNFIDEYMAEGSNSIVQIMNDAVLIFSSLQQPAQLAQEGAITAMLTWGAEPDVDLHTFEPNGSHVYYAQLHGVSGYLDVDDVTGYGPEHYYVSCTSLEPGVYHIGVNYFNGSSPETAQMQIRAGLSVRTFTRNLLTAVGTEGDNNPVLVADITVTGDQQTGFSFDIQEVVTSPPSSRPPISFGQF